MTYLIDIQNACTARLPASKTTLRMIARSTLQAERSAAELTLRFVERSEMIHLNHTYRQINAPTNVLAFPAQLPDIIPFKRPFLGDVIICPTVLKTECIELRKPMKDHLAHLVVHGILHLLGYDHMEEQEAQHMQDREIKVLMQLGYAHPYPIHKDENDAGSCSK